MRKRDVSIQKLRNNLLFNFFCINLNFSPLVILKMKLSLLMLWPFRVVSSVRNN